MTPSELETYCRRVTRKESDDFYASAEIIENYLYDACLQVSMLVPCIESTTTTPSVASTQNYDVPATAIGVKRVEYNGKKLARIDLRDYDTLRYSNSIATTTGTPSFYFIRENDIWLYPIPAEDSVDIDIFTWDYHAAVTSVSTLQIPVQWHVFLCDYVISQMYAKDQDQRSQIYFQKWEQDKARIAADWQRAQKKDRFSLVRDEDSLPATDMGMI